jgi:Ser/Thr protein kinase RdoA (MazF antagonist)
MLGNPLVIPAAMRDRTSNDYQPGERGTLMKWGTLKPYSCLSRAGKLRRLRTLAESALSQYELHDPVLTHHVYATNLLYRVITASGDRYMLRLATPGWRTEIDLRSEAIWLEALARDTDVPVPVMLHARSGEYVLPMQDHSIPDCWNASLMRWVPGRDLGHYLTVENLESMGRLFAELHNHGANWNPPAGFTTRRFEHWLSRGEKNMLVDEQPTANVAHPVDCLKVLDSVTGKLLERLHRHVEGAYRAIDRSDLRVIHCDLWHNNIRLHQGVLHPLDFEDTVWGFRAHDIAMAMLDLLDDTDGERYSGLLAAFRRGYETLLSWPDDPIEPFQIGRLLWIVNWVARNQPESFTHAVKRHLPVFEHYEQTGEVIRPPTS